MVRKHHKELIDAIQSHDGERASAVVNSYMEAGAGRVLDMLAKGELPEPSAEAEAEVAAEITSTDVSA
jgi:DNA-binding GntR family transcriptional regulator